MSNISTSSLSTATLPSYRIACGVIVPGVILALDLWLIERMAPPGRDDIAAALTLAIFVAQIGLLSILCGRFVEPPWLRWVVYGWGFVFVDTIVMIMSVADSRLPGNTKSLLMTSLLAAQLGLVTVWAILGPTRWTIRWPVAVALILLLCIPLAELRNHLEFAPLFAVQSVAFLAVCIVLRRQQFRIIVVQPELSATGKSTSRMRIQFGVRDIIVWTASLAVILAAAKAFDLLSARKIAANSMVTGGILSAIVLSVALWAALGKGKARVRWPLFAGVAALGGVIFAVHDWRLTNARYWPNDWWFSFWTPSYRPDYYHEPWHLIAWICLSGGLLFASLLIFRTLGYRLGRESATASISSSA